VSKNASPSKHHKKKSVKCEKWSWCMGKKNFRFSRQYINSSLLIRAKEVFSCFGNARNRFSQKITHICVIFLKKFPSQKIFSGSKITKMHFFKLTQLWKIISPYCSSHKNTHMQKFSSILNAAKGSCSDWD
jgi:hypothetical protein